jgi:hypothetical protein
MPLPPKRPLSRLLPLRKLPPNRLLPLLKPPPNRLLPLPKLPPNQPLRLPPLKHPLHPPLRLLLHPPLRLLLHPPLKLLLPPLLRPTRLADPFSCREFCTRCSSNAASAEAAEQWVLMPLEHDVPGCKPVLTAPR